MVLFYCGSSCGKINFLKSLKTKKGRNNMMNKNMLFDENGRPYVLHPSVGDLLHLEGFTAKDGTPVHLVTIFSEYPGAYTVHSGGDHCHFLPKRMLESREVKAVRVDEVIPSDDPNAELLHKLKALGKVRRTAPDANFDEWFYRNNDESYEECVRELLAAIERNGYIDRIA